MFDQFEIYVCPVCGNTLRWPVMSTSMPNITCGPHLVNVDDGWLHQRESYFHMEKIYESKEQPKTIELSR